MLTNQPKSTCPLSLNNKIRQPLMQTLLDNLGYHRQLGLNLVQSSYAIGPVASRIDARVKNAHPVWLDVEPHARPIDHKAHADHYQAATWWCCQTAVANSDN